MDNLWEKALPLLKAEVNEQVYSSWFAPISQVSFENNTLTLGVPNKFFETWIKENYEQLIITVFKALIGEEISLGFSLIASPLASDAEAPINGRPPEQQKDILTNDPAKKSDAMGWLKTVFSGTKQTPESYYQKIGLNPKNTFENFVVGQNNRFAHAAALAISENPAKAYNPFFLHGGVGLGKTHLLQAIGHKFVSLYPKLKILYISSEEFTNQLIAAIRTRTTSNFRNMYRNVDLLLIDDIQFIAGKDSTQEEFFHTFNRLYDSHKQIIISSDRSPKEIPKLEERLVSRFDWGLRADIQPPAYETRIAIFEKKCENESVPIPKEVITFLAEHVKTNIREMEGALIRVVAYANLSGLELTVAVAREVLKDMLTEEEKKISISLIQKEVSSFFNMETADLISRKRTQAIAYPRQIAMFLSRSLTDHSLPEIGAAFGGRDHTTVLHAVDKLKKDMEKEEKTRSLIHTLTMKIKK